MPSARRPRLTSQIARLRRRIAQLEAALSESGELSAGLRALDAFVRRHFGPTNTTIVAFTEDLRSAVFAGASAKHVLGCTLEELQARPDAWMQRIEINDLPKVREAVDGAVAGKATHALYRTHGPGEVRWIRARFARDASPGKPVSIVGILADVTQPKATEEAARRSEERFRALAVYSPMGIFQCDLAGNALFMNDRYTTIAGSSPADTREFAWLRTVHPDDRVGLLAKWQEAVDSRSEFVHEFRFLHDDGTVRWALANAVPMHDQAQEVTSYLGNVFDITERTIAEEALRESEERFRLLSNDSPVGIFQSDESGQLVYVNRRLQTIPGYPAAELFGDGFSRAILPVERHLDLANWLRITSTLEPYEVHRTIVNGRGETRWIHVRAMPIVSQEDAMRGGIGTVEDITERRLAEQELCNNEARLRAILDTASDGIVTIDESSVIEQFNPGAERMFGYRAEEVLGQNIRMLLLDAGDGQYERRARRPAPFRRPLAHRREVVGRRKDGTPCELEVSVGQTTIAGRSIFTAILHDISARKLTERRLRESEKLAATGRIAARVAHEINNPLAGIKNSFYLIKDAISPEHEHYGYVTRIDHEIGRIACIVRQMFDLYRPTQATQGQIQPSAVVRDVVAMLQPIAEAREVQLRIDTAAAVVSVQFPEDSLRQILYNVIVNAIEASPRGGVVGVEARLLGHVLDVFVSDEGAGIPPDQQAHIYEPFFTTKTHADTGGLGLGLSISRGIVEAMQGTLDFKSEPGRGTVFHISLPMESQVGGPCHEADNAQDPVH